MNKCSATTDKGKACGMAPLKGTAFCFVHSPSTREQHKEATAKGGKAVAYDRGLLQLEPVDLTDTKVLLPLIADTINRTRRVKPDGTMDVKTANTIGHLARVMLEVQKTVGIEERLSELEQKVGSK